MPGSIAGWAEPSARSPGERPSRWNTGLGLNRDAGVDQHGGQGRETQRRAHILSRAAHEFRTRVEADGHVGAGRARGVHQARIALAQFVGAGQQPQRRGGVGRAAANAGGHGQPLGQAERAKGKPRNPCGKLAGGAEHEIVRPRARRLRRGADDFERERGARLQRQRVAGAGESDEALQFVIAVDRAASQHMQREVDFGRGAGGQHDHRNRRSPRRAPAQIKHAPPDWRATTCG